MSKWLNYVKEDIKSDSIDSNRLYTLQFSTSVGTWVLLFFYILPMLVSIGKHLFDISSQERSTTLGLINISLYYVLNPIIATILVKWQNKRLAKKPIKFRKKYVLVIFFIFLIFILLRISSRFIFKA